MAITAMILSWQLRGSKSEGRLEPRNWPWELFLGCLTAVADIKNGRYYLAKFDHDLTATSLESWFLAGNHPQMALLQVSEILSFA